MPPRMFMAPSLRWMEDGWAAKNIINTLTKRPLMNERKMICCFGELLLRFSPALEGGFIKDQSMPVYIGGAELNAATALSLWKQPVRYVTALPDNSLTNEMIGSISQKNIDTGFIKQMGDRIGTYYLPQGTDLKNSAVIYDRNFSSFSTLQPGVLDWDSIFEDVDWFHFSAISPALNASVAAVCLEGATAARAKGITVSIDLNYRAKLWQYGELPTNVMPQIVKCCDVVMGNIWAANSLLGIPITIGNSTQSSSDDLARAALQSMELLQQAFPSANSIAYTFRMEENYFACLKRSNGYFVSQEFDIKNVIDKVGSGDCFMGGLIYGIYNDLPGEEVINFAAAAAVLKLGQTGDATSSSLTDVYKKMNPHGENQ